MKILDRYFSEFRKKSYIAQLYDLGLNTQEIREDLVEKFKPYFENKEYLEEIVLGPLSTKINSFMHILGDEWCLRNFKECLNIYHLAKQENAEKCSESFSSWHEDIYKAISNTVTLLNLERDKNVMNLEEFSKDCFELVGNIIEVSISAHLKLLYQQLTIINDNFRPFEEIKKRDLGQVIDSFLGESNLSELVKPSQWNIKLNQWRNIAQHYSYEVNDEVITCKYGKYPKQKEIKLYKNELWLLCIKLFEIIGILKVAHSIFFLDNLLTRN